jgi:ABC-2 type transport system permease protein
VSAWVAVVRTLVGAALTTARVAALALLGLVAIVVGLAVGQADPVSPLQAGGDLVNVYGLTVLAPVVTLVLASATLGDTIDDGTLVYLWLRPIGRTTIASAAFTAAVIAAMPVVVVPLTIAASLTGGGGDLVAGTVVSAVVAVIGYAGVFVALGLIAKRALAWGMLYILIWEGFIARAGTSSSRWSVQYYARSLLADIAGVSFRLGDAAAVAAVAVPVAVAATGVALTALHLRRMSVA